MVGWVGGGGPQAQTLVPWPPHPLPGLPSHTLCPDRVKSLNPRKESALRSSRDSHLVVFLPSYRGVWQATACGVTKSQTGPSMQALLNDQYLLQGAHRGEREVEGQEAAARRWQGTPSLPLSLSV